MTPLIASIQLFLFSPPLLQTFLSLHKIKTMSFQINGKLVKKMDAESKTARFYHKRVCNSNPEQYPQYVKFQLVQDRCSVIDRFNENDEVTVHFDLRGENSKGKYFTNQCLESRCCSGLYNMAGQDLVADKDAPDPF